MSMSAFAAAVYPRPRGGTIIASSWATLSRGLSPPTRGNHCDCARFALGRGSIPAHAGEPIAIGFAYLRKRVYPRPRGGTIGLDSIIPAARGLSPPTRGNQSLASCAKR